MNSSAALGNIAILLSQSSRRIPSRDFGGSGRFALAVATSVGLTVVVMAFAVSLGARGLDEHNAVFLSWISAQIASLPLILWLVREMPSPATKVAVLCWPMMRVLLLVFSPSADVALTIGDSAALNQWGIFFSTYWQAGGDWILPSDVLANQSVHYVGAPYLFGIPYLVFGPHAYVTVPWLAAMQCLSAAIVLQLMRAVQVPGAFETLYALYCPAWLFYSNNLYRDPLLMVGLTLLPLAVFRIMSQRYVSGLFGASVASVIILSLRQEYLVVLWAFAVAVVALSTRRKSVVILCVAILAAAGVIGSIQGGDTSLLEGLQKHLTSSSAVIETAGTHSFVERFTHLQGLTSVIAVPLRVVASIVAPFPFLDPSIIELYPWWVYVALHFMQAIFHLGVIVVIAMSYRTIRKTASRSITIIAVWGLLLLLSGSLTWVAFNRYVVVSFVFMLPLLTASARRGRFQQIVLAGVAGVCVLHGLYYLLRI